MGDFLEALSHGPVWAQAMFYVPLVLIVTYWGYRGLSVLIRATPEFCLSLVVCLITAVVCVGPYVWLKA
jgi:hypothetical protein